MNHWTERNFPTFLKVWRKFTGQRDFRAVITAKHNSDWIVSGIGHDADLWQNIYGLRNRCRDLFKMDPYVRKFAQELRANVFGCNGISLKMQITEESDRVVYAPDEKGFNPRLLRKLAIRERILKKRNPLYEERGWNKAKATVRAGDPDYFANDLIYRKWCEWQRQEFCTVTRRLTYQQVRELRITSAARDGDFFIRMLRDPKINKFGFSLQLINSEWVDHNYNDVTRGGNQIRMGIELNAYGAPVAYYVIERDPYDWQWARIGQNKPVKHVRIAAADMIFYGIIEDADQFRCPPWIVSAITKLRHLDKYEEAELISARVEACKGGHYVPQTGNLDQLDLADKINPASKELQQTVEPGQWKALPFGWDAKAHDPKHPNGNFEMFRKATLRGICSGLPGGSYNVIASDLEGVNYSSMKGGEISVHEAWKMLQAFDIDTAERRIFEAWLEMSLLTQAVPLPYAKFDKLNKPRFQGRRWQGLEPTKDATANAQAITNRTKSRTRIAEEAGDDWEEIALELAEEELILEEYGIPSQESIAATAASASEDQSDENAQDSGSDDAKELANNRLSRVNGH